MAATMHNGMTTEQIEALDVLIFYNEKIAFCKFYREFTGESLSNAINALSQRYQYLRECYPEKFTISDVEYWSGFYS